MTKDDDASSSIATTEKKPVQTEGRWARWGRAGFDKSIKVSDWLSPYANKVSSAVGGERFWPQSNDMPLEIEKCERILRAFTVEGVQQKDTKEESVQDSQGNWIKKKVKVLRKIPPAAIRNAKGIAIYSSMRSGIAPLGGGGGSGLFLARLPNGSWSAPSAISPQSGAVGLLLGVDFLDVVLLINSEKTLETFKTHRVDLGAETGVTAGPYGTGYSAEASYDRAPVYSYVRNRGAYAGVELLGQVFLHRFDENERFYYWPGIGARDIFEGKVRIPPVVYPLHRALRDAETGRAQGGKLERTEYDIIKIPESEVFKHIGPNGSASPHKKRFVAGGPTTPNSGLSTPRSADANGSASLGKTHEGENDSLQELDIEEAANEAERRIEAENGAEGDGEDERGEEDIVQDGERLRLPPTPAELEMMEAAGIPDEEDLRVEKEDRVRIYQLPAPPMHPDVQRHWDIHPILFAKRPTEKLVMDGPNGPEVREAQFVPLPPSPILKDSVKALNLQEVPLLSDTVETSVNDSQIQTLEQPVEEEEGEVLARGIEGEDADKVMEAALEGDTAEAKRIGKEAEEEKEHEDDTGAVPLLSKENEDSASLTEAPIAEESNIDDEAKNTALDDHARSSEDEVSLSSHAQSFASLEDDSNANVDEESTKDTLMQEINIEEPPTEDTTVESTSNDAAIKSVKEEEEITESVSKSDVDASSRPTTPTEGTQNSESENASGTATPSAPGRDKNGPVSTPSRPPRRKRPPKKGN
jgi:SH3 domain-containing YSC84-like protein 1